MISLTDEAAISNIICDLAIKMMKSTLWYILFHSHSQ